MGRVDPAISALPWLERQPRLWPIVREALYSLMHDYEQVVIEGGGSPAEINLRTSDIVNMRVARECQADVYLVDLDRSGAFAHLLGTWHCLEVEEQALVKGFILNKFRGDPALLGDAMDWLHERTGIPTVALLPWCAMPCLKKTPCITVPSLVHNRSTWRWLSTHTPAISTSSTRWSTHKG
jgi:adenosylcobyric acid synthase